MKQPCPQARVLASLGVVVCVVALSACGSSSSKTSSSASTTVGAPASQSLKGKSITMVAYGGASQDALASAYAAPFQQQTGATVQQDPTLDYAKVAAQVKSGNVSWDVIEADPFATAAGCGTQYERLNVSLAGINPSYLTKGDDCGVPADVYSIVLMYDKTKFGKTPPTSWADFFDTKKFPGKRGVFNYSVGGGLEAAALASGATSSTLYPLDVKGAIAKLNSIKSSIVFYNTLGQSVEQLLAGDVSMSMMWNTRAYAAVQAGADFAPAWGGNIQGWDSWAIPKGSPNKDAAEALLKLMAQPRPQADLAANIPFGPTAKGAVVKAGALAQSFLPSEHTGDAVFIDQNWWAKNLDSASNAWSQFTSG
jgi:putative spermidine/putrescine transport system substrate-binding protein